MNISSSTRLYAVIGHPIAHSLSPQMQNAALEKMGLDAVYLAFDVRPERLLDTLKSMMEMGFAGVNLTVPLKEAAFRGLKNIDPAARRLGSVNTVKFFPGGMKGYSTDGHGFLAALKKTFKCSPEGQIVFLLGCGGAGRAVALACAGAGAKKIVLADSDLKRAEKLAVDIKAARPRIDLEIAPAPRAARNRAARSADLVVQATPVGMHPNDLPLLDKDAFSRKQKFYDLIYMFPETGLMKIARAAGALAANGLDMLLFQGALALELWTGKKAPIDVMRKTLEKAVYGREL
ncbi:MAG: shikimate dehydrogenase [Kiritimatiellae bacterium]|nr:shikimate dehydrogenase [Kiritimatiellia bacterium]